VANEDFTKIAVWLKAQELAVDVAHIVSKLPRDRSADAIGRQLLRSAGSVPANIAEGYGRYSQAAYRSHLSIARRHAPVGAPGANENAKGSAEGWNLFAKESEGCALRKSSYFQMGAGAEHRDSAAQQTWQLPEGYCHVRGSLFESQSWLDLLGRAGKLSEELKAPLVYECQQVGRMLTYRMKTLGPAEQTYARARSKRNATT